MVRSYPFSIGRSLKKIKHGLREFRLVEWKSRLDTSSMAINIKSTEAERLVRELAELTGESITDAIHHAVRERLTRERLRRMGGVERSWSRIERIQERIGAVPLVDGRTVEELLAYDERGVPR